MAGLCFPGSLVRSRSDTYGSMLPPSKFILDGTSIYSPSNRVTRMTKDEYIDVMGTKMKGGIFSMLTLYIITSSSKPIHGYAITKGLEEGTGGRIYIQAGTLYPILKNLENHGLVRHKMVDSTEGPQRKVYTTTAAGKKALGEGMGLLGDLLSGVQMTMGDDWPVLNVHG